MSQWTENRLMVTIPETILRVHLYRQTQPRLEAKLGKGTKPGSQRIQIVSFTEILITEQLKESISNLRQPTDQDFSISIKESDKNVCQLCRLDHILPVPEPIYCSLCAAPIKGIKHTKRRCSTILLLYKMLQRV